MVIANKFHMPEKLSSAKYIVLNSASEMLSPKYKAHLATISF